MRKPIIALCSGLALAAAVPAAAQTPSRLSSVYVGADVGEAQYRDGCDLAANCDDKDTSWGIFAGYQFIPNLAAEVAYRDLGSISAPGGSVDGEALELVGVGRIPITERFAAYGKLGGYRGELEGRGNRESNSDLTYGLGLQFDFTRNLGVRGEWQRYPGMGGGDFGDETDVDVIRVGALFRFQ
ncbi:MAG TPA: outer membrane beta-barrel protein [Burkholderiales bacterium]